MNNKVILCLLIIAIVSCSIAGCTESNVSGGNSSAQDNVMSGGEYFSGATTISHYKGDYYSEITVVYIPETGCVCHVYDTYYGGGISCTPRNMTSVKI